MLNVYIINIEKDQYKIDNIVTKVDDQKEVNLMKVNPMFIENRRNNHYLNGIYNLCNLFCPFKLNCYGITHLKLIENIFRNDESDYSLIFENNIIPIHSNLNDIVLKIIENSPPDWDIIRLYDKNNDGTYINETKEIYQRLGNKITNAYLIRKSGQEKILEYKFKNSVNRKLKLNIYKSPIKIFETNIGEANRIYNGHRLVGQIYHNVTLYFVEILFMLMIIVTIGSVVYAIAGDILRYPPYLPSAGTNR